MRYNGTFKHIGDNEIDKYIQAWQTNFEKFQSIENQIPTGGEFSTSGAMGMSIRIGGWREGVCLTSYHMPIKTQAELDKVIEDYNKAKVTALKLQNILKDLND